MARRLTAAKAGGRRLVRGGALGLVGAATIALVAAQLAPPARATAPPSGPGSALATASLVTVGPSYEGLAITVTAGSSTASYQANEAQATAAAVNAASLSGLTGSAPAISAISPLTADSATGPVDKSSGSPLLGLETVKVAATPAANATTQLIGLSLPGLLQIDGDATSSVSYGSGEQAADASADLTIQLGGGVVTLDGVRWTASQHRGGQTLTAGSFTLGSISVAHVKVPIATATQLASALTAVNRALAPFAFSVILPTDSTDPTSGTVSIGGLDLRLSRSALTNALLGPLLGPIGQTELQIGKALAAGGKALAQLASTLGTGELLGGLVLGILAGAGQVNLSVGGVSADSQLPPSYTNPFGTGSGSGAGNPTPSSSIPAQQGGAVSSGQPTIPGSGTAATSGGGPATNEGAALAPGDARAGAGAPPAQLSPVRTGPVHCTSTSPSGRPGCWQGAATVVAGVLLGVGVALFAADAYVGRRRRFRVVKEVVQ